MRGSRKLSDAVTSVAPGQSVSSQETLCYNCGSRTHWMVACQEPTRDVPAGFRRRQSQRQDQIQTPGQSKDPMEKKGPVVTRYAHPPAKVPLSSRYSLFQMPIYPPDSSTSAQQGYPPPYSPPPLASYSANNPAPPAPPPPPVYAQYLPSPPLMQYSQQHSVTYVQPQCTQPYSSQHYYHNIPAPALQPYIAETYGAQYASHLLSPLPLSSLCPLQHHPSEPPPPLPPPADYGSYSVVPAGPYHHTPLGVNPYPPPAGWSQRPQQSPHFGPPLVSSLPYRRVKDQKRLAVHRSHKDKCRSRYRSPNRNRSAGARPSFRGRPRQQEHGFDHHLAVEDSGGHPLPQTKAIEDGDDNDLDVACEADFKVVFAEQRTKGAEPVGIPLSYEYNEAPTIPPAYNSESIKSAFFNQGSRREFSRSIRATDRWTTAQLDPVFIKYSGMILRRFPDYPYEYPSYDTSVALSSSAPIRLPPPLPVERSKNKTTQDWEERFHDSTQPRILVGEDFQRRGPALEGAPKDHRDRDSAEVSYSCKDEDSRGPLHALGKRQHSRPWTHRVTELKRNRHLSSRLRTRVPEDSGLSTRRTPPTVKTSPASRLSQHDSWSPPTAEGEGRSEITLCAIHRDGEFGWSLSDRADRPPSSFRHDSGYYSGYSQEQQPTSTCYREIHDHESSKRLVSCSSYEPVTSRSWSQSPRSTVGHGLSTRASSSPIRAHKRCRSTSPLTALEAELLGLSGSADLEAENNNEKETLPREAAKVGNGVRVKMLTPRKVIKRQTKIAAVYSRRW